MKKYISISLFALVGFLSLAVSVRADDTEWVPLKTGVNQEFSAITCPSARTCYIVSGLYSVGGTGGIVKTTDGGDTFTTISSPSSDPMHAVSCSSEALCFVVGDFGTVLKTADGGATWKTTQVGSASNRPKLTGVYTPDGIKVTVVGKDGVILRSTDGGATWTPPSIRTYADFYDIFFTDSLIGFIAGNDGALLKTTDGGEIWQSRGSLGTAGSIYAMRGGGSRPFYAVGDTFNKSTDGGDTWAPIIIGSLRGYRAISVPDGSTAYLITESNAVYKTTDSGATWNPTLSGATVILHAITCPAPGYCLLIGGSGNAFRLGTPPAAPPTPAPVPVVVTTTAPAVVTTSPVTVATPSKEELAKQLNDTLAVLSALQEKQKPVPNTVSVSPVASAEPSLNRTLKKGANGADVKLLQELLASVGVFSKEDVSDIFGPLTAKAVGKFQEQYELASPGDVGYGQAGPKTRAKLIEASKGGAEIKAPATQAKATPSAKSAFTRSLKKGLRGNDVKKLQELLSADKEIYPDGEVSGFFGPATAKAVGRFQEKYELAFPGDDGYGEVGPRTQKKLIETAQE